MRLAYVLARYPEPSETFIRREIDALRKRGHEITVCALAAGSAGGAGRTRIGPAGVFYRPSWWSWAAVVMTCRLLVLRPLRLMRLVGRVMAAPGGSAGALVRVLRNLHAIAFFSRRLDLDGVEHVHGCFLNTPGLLAMAVATINAIPFSAAGHARDVFVEGVSLPLLTGSARFVVFCNQAVREAAGRSVSEAARRKFSVVHHGLDLSRWSESDGLRASPPLLLAVGRLIEKKGFEILIRACGLLREKGLAYRAEICGDGPGRGRLESLIAELGLGERVILCGWRGEADLIESYRAASVVVVPSVRAGDGDEDGIPNVLLEAAACGAAVIAGKLAGPAEFVEDQVTGLLVEAGDADDLAAAIERLLTDAGLRTRLVANASRRLRESFDLQGSAARMEALFAGVV